MKCIAAVLLIALVGVALAKPLETESLEPTKAESVVAAARDKRGLLVGAAYTAPVAYSAYTAPVAYTAAYKYPSYAAYTGYPYYAAAYTSPYASPYASPYYVL